MNPHDKPSAWLSVYSKADKTDFLPFEAIRGRDCEITLDRRPYYCDRGNYIARLETARGSPLALSIDGADMWPRYFFNYYHAKAEIEAWLKKRGQWIAGASEPAKAPPLSMLAVVIDNETILPLPEPNDKPAMASLMQQLDEAEYLTKILRGGQSAALVRFHAVETIQQLRASEEKVNDD